MRAVNGFPNFYVDDNGKIYTTIFGEKEELDTKEMRNGRLEATLSCSEFTVKFVVDRVVAEAYNLYSPDEHEDVVHLDGNVKNNQPMNLKGATYTEIRANKIRDKLSDLKATNDSELTESLILVIQRLWNETNMSGSEIALVIGKNPSTVNDVIAGRSWSELGLTFKKDK